MRPAPRRGQGERWLGTQAAIAGTFVKSALWGSGNRGGEFRSNALWGKGGRGSVVTLVGVLVLSLAAGAASASGTLRSLHRGQCDRRGGRPAREGAGESEARCSTIIVQSAEGAEAAETAFETWRSRTTSSSRTRRSWLSRTSRRLTRLPRQARRSASKARLRPSVSVGGRERDERRRFARCPRRARRPLRLHQRCLAGDVRPAARAARSQHRPHHHRGRRGRVPRLGLDDGQSTTRPSSSGRTSRASAHSGRDSAPHACDRDRRLGDRHVPARLRRAAITQVNFVTSGKPNGALDGRGHGSFVAGIAAGSAKDDAGVAPNAPLISLDVMDDSGSGRTSDVIAATEWIFKNHDDVRHQRRELLAPRRRQGPLLRRSAEQGGLEVVACRRGRGRSGGQLRQGRGPERRALRSRQQPVRDHGRRDRHRRHRQDERRRPCSVVGIRPDAGRLLEARDLRSRSDDGRPDSDELHPRDREGEQDQDARLRRALRDVVRGAGDLGYRGSDPRPEPGHDAGPGQGRRHAAGPRGAARREATRAASARSTRCGRC